MAENLNLKNTVLIEDQEYNINAVHSDVADKASYVSNNLKIKSSLLNGVSEKSFNGSSEEELTYVPADQGGIFNKPIYLSKPTTEPWDNEIITSGQVDNRIVNLKQSEPLCLWDTSFDPSDISKSLYMLKDNEDKAYRFTIITGTEPDFYLFQDAIKGDFDSTSDALTYDIINPISFISGWKTDNLADSASGVIRVPKTHTGKYFTLNGTQSTTETTQKVTEIAEHTFKNNTKITSVVLPENISIIGSRAFYGCTNLKSVVIPNSAVGKTAASTSAPMAESWFENCTNLRKVTLGTGLTAIGVALFRNCTSLISLVIPENVTAISKEAFKGCTNLSTIVIPKSVASIDDDAFVDCPNLNTICYTGSETEWNAISISDSGNAQVNTATKTYNYVANLLDPSNAPSASISINELAKGPFIYICNDTVADSSLAANKIFLKFPDSTDFIEISKSASRLNSLSTGSQNYYTYEGLAEIIARINTRLDGLGVPVNTTVLSTAPLKLSEVNDLVPEIDITHPDIDPFDPEEVPTVQQLEKAIADIYGITKPVYENGVESGTEPVTTIGEILNTSNRDSLAQLREDLTDLAEEMYYADHESDFFATNSRIDALEDGLKNGTVVAKKANTLWDSTNNTLFSTAENVPVYFKDGQPVACGDGTGTGETPADGSVPINISGNAKTADQVNSSLTIQLNNGTITSGTNPNKFVFNGAEEKTVNITPAKIGAVAATKKASATATATTVKTIAFVLDGTKLTITTTS